ncbi:MAG TPA: phospholipid carrier-dependent glycosyltransferase [Chthoniobacterales bacterium]
MSKARVSPGAAKNVYHDHHLAPETVQLHEARSTAREIVRRKSLTVLTAVLVLLCAFYLLAAAVPHLFDQIDGQYAGAAREMMARGDWLVPTQDGVPRLQKPPLVYWLEIVSLHALGPSAFAARLPVILATLAWFVAVGRLGWLVTQDARAGLAAAIILASFTGTFLFTHLVMPEPFLALTMALTVLALWSARDPAASPSRSFWFLLLAWGCIACGCLAKGLHALLFPVLTYLLVAWQVPAARRPAQKFIWFWPGWLLLICLVVPWYGAVELRYPGFLKEHFWNEQLGHVFNRRSPPDTDRVPLPTFWVEHLGLFFPWTVFLPLVLPKLWAALRRWPEIAGQPLGFLWVWFAVNGVTIAFSSIQDYYLLVSWPAVAVGLAMAFRDWDAASSRRATWGGWVLVALGLAGVAVRIAFRVPRTHVDHGAIDGASHGLDVLRNFPGTEWDGLLGLLGVAGFILLAGGFSVIWFARRQRSFRVLTATAMTSLGLLACSVEGLRITEPSLSSWPFTAYLQTHAPPDYRVASLSEANDYTSLFFYLPHPVIWIDAHADTEFATRVFGAGRNLYWSRQQLVDGWGQNRAFYLIADQTRMGSVAQLLHNAGGFRVALTSGSRVLLANPAAPPEQPALHPAR